MKQMSASNEKKVSHSQAFSGVADPKTAREARQRKEEKRSNLLYLLIAVIFVVVAVVSITWKSGIIQKKATAATINDKNYSAAEVQYYYKNAYQQFVSQYSSYLSYFGLDTSKDLKSQKCNMTSDGGTWYDYFLKEGLTTMSSVHALNDAAAKADYKWTDDMQTQYDDNLKSMKTAAKNYNYSLEQYIKAVYGSIVTLKTYENEMKLGVLAQAYKTTYSDGLKYTTDEITSAYKDDTKSYDVVDYQSVKIDGSVSTASTSSSSSKSASSKSTKASTPTKEQKTAAMNTAKASAVKMLSSYKSGSTLVALAKNDKKATYTNGEAGTYDSSSALMKWLFKDSRKAGDSAVVKDSANSAYYVVVFTKRYRNEYKTIDVRHILIKPATGTKQEGQDGYEAEQKKLKAAAKAKAEALLKKWKAGDATEKSFSALAKKNSEDTGSAENGGLYTQVYKKEMETSFNDWCFDSSRKAGDTGIVETSYGYHVMYFVGTDIPYWQVQVTNALKQKDYNTWYTKLTKNYTAKKHSFGLKYVG
jgi:parvulin-like peptidyl-prolyl isomerase